MSTYQQIAEMAGVSVLTVSKALSGNAEISKKTRDTIFLLAKQMGYFEKRSRRKLSYSKNKAMRIIILYPEIETENLLNEINALIKSVKQYGGQPLVFCVQRENVTKIINEYISEGFGDGFIVKGLDETENFSLPVVSISSDIIRIPYSSVVLADNNAVAYDAVKYLKEHGHTKIGYAGNDDLTMLKAFKSALRKCSVSYSKQYIYEADIEANLTKLINDCLNNELTALFVPVPETAGRLVGMLEEKCVKVPEDISVITVGGSSERLTSFELNFEQMAQYAAKQLVDEIKCEHMKIVRFICEHQLTERESVKDITG